MIDSVRRRCSVVGELQLQDAKEVLQGQLKLSLSFVVRARWTGCRVYLSGPDSGQASGKVAN